jgi:very-short-patch-repair endonuclease
MIDENFKVVVSWNPKNINYYKNKGYTFTKLYDEFEVSVCDLHPNSSVLLPNVCDHCGKEYDVYYSHYTRAILKFGEVVCQDCSAIRRANETLKVRQEKMYAQILEFCKLHNYTLITKKEELINNQSNVAYICPIHGKCTTKVTNIQQGKQCYKCSRALALKKKNETTLKQRQETLYTNALNVCIEKGYELISKKEDIINNRTYIVYKCPIHGLQKMRVSNLINGRGCPECNIEAKSELYRLSPDEVERRVADLCGKLLNKQDYINRTERNLIIECAYCGTPFTTSLVLFTQHGGQMCSNCKDTESIGERKIRIYLESNNIIFEQEKWFADCRDIKPLPFDFYLPDYNTIIEFDGEQHYKQGHFTHSNLSYVQTHDAIKNEYCKNNNIELIRTPYWELNNIETILNNKLLISHKDIV